MKKYLILLLLAVTTISSWAQNNQTLYLTQSLTDKSIQNVEAKTFGGNIRVRGGNSDDARIEVYITSNNGHQLSKDEIEEKLKDYDLNISASANQLTAIAKRKNKMMNWKKTISISFKIYVPQNVSTTLSTSGGSIYLDNLNGDENFSTSGGSLHVTKLTGRIKGRTSGGSVHIFDSKDDIDLSTSGGSIEAKNSTGKIKLKTSGGHISLDNLEGHINASTSGGHIDGHAIKGGLSAHTSGGSIKMNELSCSLDASTSGGSINAMFAEVGEFIKLSNSGGRITLKIPKDNGYDLKLYGSRMDKDFSLTNFNGTVKENKIEGSVNGGGIPVSVNAGSGKVQLSFK